MPEKEYIEREATIDFVKQNTPHFDGETTMECVERSIRYAPTADVAEVKHGEWEVVDSDLGWIDGKCSACGYTDCFDENGFYNYCPECGAKMDGGKNGK